MCEKCKEILNGNGICLDKSVFREMYEIRLKEIQDNWPYVKEII